MELYGSKGIAVVGVTKAVCGYPEIASVLVENGITTLGDSRLSNISRMQKAGVKARFLLLRSPMLSQAEEVINTADCSLNSEISVLKSLSKFALQLGVIHCVILMVELGDLREGLMPDNLHKTIAQILELKGLELVGLGTNLACMGGIIPDESKMNQLSSIATTIEEKFGIVLKIISGGNSANYRWFMHNAGIGRVNSLRLGESLLLGRETLHRKPIPGLFTDAFTLITEVIEAQIKPSLPFGDTGQNAFGNKPLFEDKGFMRRALVGIGQQDVMTSDLKPLSNVEILSASSDHVALNARATKLKVGQEVRFGINYSALLSLMTSPYVSKSIIE